MVRCLMIQWFGRKTIAFVGPIFDLPEAGFIFSFVVFSVDFSVGSSKALHPCLGYANQEGLGFLLGVG